MTIIKSSHNNGANRDKIKDFLNHLTTTSRTTLVEKRKLFLKLWWEVL